MSLMSISRIASFLGRPALPRSILLMFAVLTGLVGCRPPDYRVRAGSLTSNIAVCRSEVIQLLASYPDLLSLSPAEREIAATASRRFHALLDLHVGKQALRQGDFTEAQLRLAAANRFLRNPKTAAFVWMLKLSPGFAAGAERWLRRRAE